jgi:hypothetical protein
MARISNNRKIYVSITAWLLASGFLFWYGFPAFEVSNLVQARKVLEKSKMYQDLQQQQASFQAGKKDLETLAKKPYQPGNFFSQDTSLVKEIVTLENLAATQNVQLDLQVTGTKATATKAPTAGDVVQLPYTIVLTGTTPDVVSFLEYFENLSFVTHATHIDVSSIKDGQIKATLSAIFFIAK